MSISPSATTLSERLRQSVLPLWQRQVEHPFVAALGNGTLPRENFEFYIRQDALFLDVLTKTFAYASTRTNDPDEMKQFGQYLLDTLQVEKELHQHYARRFGITLQQMAETSMAPTNYAYTRHMLAIASTGTLPEIITVMLPCAWIYAEVGQYFNRTTSPSADHPYADWLATYASPDFDAVEIWLRARLDKQSTNLTAQQEQRLFDIFRISTCYEWMFWEMAWQREQWPSY